MDNVFSFSSSEETKHSVVKNFVFLLAIISFVALTVFTITNYLDKNITVAIIEGILALIVLYSIIAMLVTNNPKYGEQAATVVVIAIATVLVISGGFKQSGIAWIFTLPAISFFTLRLRSGFALTLAFLLYIWTIAILQNYGILQTAYFTSTLVLFSIAYIVFSIMVMIYQYTIEKTIAKLKRLLAVQELFNQILHTSRQAKDLTEFADVVIKDLVEYFELDSGTFFIHGLGDEFLELIASYKLSPQLKPLIETLPIDDPPYKQALIDHQPMYIRDFSQLDTTRASFTKSKSVIILPLLFNSELVGAITLASKRQFSIADDEKEVLERVSRDVATTIQQFQSHILVEERLV